VEEWNKISTFTLVIALLGPPPGGSMSKQKDILPSLGHVIHYTYCFFLQRLNANVKGCPRRVEALGVLLGG